MHHKQLICFVSFKNTAKCLHICECMMNVGLIVLVSHWYPLSVVFNELDKVKSAQPLN